METKVNNLIAGNVYNKQETKNFLARFLINRYYSALRKLIIKLNIKTCLEVGCGEGWVVRCIKNTKKDIIAYGCDISEEIIETAFNNNDDINFSVASIYRLPFPNNFFDLVVACEVLEHLEYPYDAIREIRRCSNSFCLFSVPIEPLWRLLNILRGAYLTKFGNTPGHIQHWTKKYFVETLRADFTVLEAISIYPWVIVLCRKIRE